MDYSKIYESAVFLSSDGDKIYVPIGEEGIFLKCQPVVKTEKGFRRKEISYHVLLRQHREDNIVGSVEELIQE